MDVLLCLLTCLQSGPARAEVVRVTYLVQNFPSFAQYTLIPLYSIGGGLVQYYLYGLDFS